MWVGWCAPPTTPLCRDEYVLDKDKIGRRTVGWLPGRSKKGRKMMGLTSEEHLYLRIVSIVVIINALVFYTMSRNLAFVSNLFEAAVLLTALTLVVLVVNVEFWWRYLRRSDNKRFWKPQTKEEMN